ncbi:TPA: ParA family protein [Vibrio parahaemolyticus]|nr:ParA family protein [Vibrio parahaemolyticus]
MKIVIAQHKGGVGKTTLALHVAGILSERELEETLLIDCDTQADSFYFLHGDYPREKLDLCNNSCPQVLWNPDRTSLSKSGAYAKYDNIVVDIDTRIQNAMQVIMEVNPETVLIPVDDQFLAVHHLREAIDLVIDSVGKFMYPVNIVVVPMGVKDANLISEIRNITKEFNVNLSPPLPYLRNEFNASFRSRSYVWNLYPESGRLVRDLLGATL